MAQRTAALCSFCTSQKKNPAAEYLLLDDLKLQVAITLMSSECQNQQSAMLIHLVCGEMGNVRSNRGNAKFCARLFSLRSR